MWFLLFTRVIPDETPPAALVVIGHGLIEFGVWRRPKPFVKVLNLAIQNCEGLVAAHERGIIHRDLKILLVPGSSGTEMSNRHGVACC